MASPKEAGGPLEAFSSPGQTDKIARGHPAAPGVDYELVSALPPVQLRACAVRRDIHYNISFQLPGALSVAVLSLRFEH
ncbi:nucleoside-diphosphate sugar epimerase [Anopheles sinensis]|uniref:Nucleoside-diphosphate sugar epimerase n=1 Tax=Anopheles sinensis TaxID=74873 RepID=A0A084VE10_ANOSI|nr:nucleoside-diphosphate sugar epimerase [Anopheles sinensis]